MLIAHIQFEEAGIYPTRISEDAEDYIQTLRAVIAEISFVTFESVLKPGG